MNNTRPPTSNVQKSERETGNQVSLALSDCSIRVFNLDNPLTYNNHGAKKTTLQQSHQPRLSFLAYTEFNKDGFC